MLSLHSEFVDVVFSKKAGKGNLQFDGTEIIPLSGVLPYIVASVLYVGLVSTTSVSQTNT